MHILILCKKFPYPLKDGEAIAIFNNIKGFSELGHTVTVLAINTVKHHFDLAELPDEVAQLASFHEVTVDTSPKYNTALMNLMGNLPYHVSRFISNNYKIKLTELLNSQQFDIIQCEGLFMGPYLGIIRQLSKAKIVMRAHNVESEIWQRMADNTRNPIKKWYIQLQANRLKRFEAAQLNRYNAIIPITDEDRKKLKAMGSEVPFYASPAGVDLKRFQLTSGTPIPNTLFFIGGLDWLPNQEGLQWFLTKVWPVLVVKRPELQLHIAGKNAPHWLLNWKAVGVTIYGEVESAPAFIAERSIMVVPLISGSGIRIKILEGMAMAKPIIATALGAEGINCTHRQHILIANTVEDYVEQVDWLIDNPIEATAIGKNARRLVENQYDNGKFAKAMIDFYTTQFYH